MRLRLRWRILLFTVVTPVTLTLATLWMVHRSVSHHLHTSIRESLERSSLVFENKLAARSEALAVAAQVIVQDPRFFSVLTLPVGAADPQFQATVRGVARDFNTITRTDLFEVLDRRGRRLASVGRMESSRPARQPLLDEAVRGAPAAGILVEEARHFQVTATPVVSQGRVAGVLLLGSLIGEPLARELRELTRSEVTFLSHGKTTGSTFAKPVDRTAVLEAAARMIPALPDSGAHVEEVPLHGESYLTLVRRIPRSRPADEQYFVMQRSLDAETAFLRSTQRGLMQLGVLAVLTALIAGFVVTERITRPVHQLVRGAEEMERGNFDYPLAIHSQDEMGNLAARFEEMRARQRDYIASLEEVARVKSEFINVASHELRTPISIIKGFHDLFVHETLGPINDQQRQALQGIQKSITGLMRVAEDATRMAQIEGERLVLQVGEHDVALLVEQAVASATADAQDRDLTITIEVQRHLPLAHLDGSRMIQAIGNLVRNAIRFTPDRGTVDVLARREHAWLVVSVRDTGVGIPEGKQAQIFGRSFMARDSLHHHSSSTLEFNSAGLGMGLAIVRGIMEAHGGTIELESRFGQGSEFRLKVPYNTTARAPRAYKAQPQPQARAAA
jgi:signal transduction histidine kinase